MAISILGVIQEETDVIKPALYLVAIRFCLGKKIFEDGLIAVYLSLVEIPAGHFQLVPIGSNWHTGFWSTRRGLPID